ncbi:MAG: isochorismatase family cysteine hydrolase [Actinomycetota bacterium]|nr:isochorismatase family cysteine hydrolase [Actinomycetota bacterium]
MNKKALLIIDMLNDFVSDGAPLKVPDIKKIINPIKREIEKARSEGSQVIYLCDNHQKDDKEFKLFPPHAVKGTEGARIIDDLKPEGNDIIVRKNTFSGFFNTNLDEILKKLSVERLIVTGDVINICVLYTVAGAVMRGYKVDVVKDAVIALNKKDYKFALEQMKNVLKVNIV